MGEPDTPKNVRHIQTFAFLDIESTGFPDDSPRIIELSIVAVSRADLLRMSASAAPHSTLQTQHRQPSTHQDSATPTTSNSTAWVDDRKINVIPKLPRVLHKYTRLYYPCKMIPPSVDRVSDLNNEALEHLPSFTEDSAQALKLFLDFPKPVALVAHNGNRFDFPIIKTELYRLGWTDKLVDLRCVDSLIALRQIDPEQEREDIAEIRELVNFFDTDDSTDELLEEVDFVEDELTEEDDFFDDELLVDACTPSKRPRTGESDKEGSPMSNTPFSSYESATRGPGNDHHALEVSAEPLLTPIKCRVAGQTAMPATPCKPAQPPPLPGAPECAQPGTPGTPGFQVKVAGGSSKVRRTLTYENNGKRRKRWHMPYKQSNLYRRLFDKEYEAHRAEEDCLALLKICGHYGSRFVEWADTFATSFDEVKRRGVRRKFLRAGKVA